MSLEEFLKNPCKSLEKDSQSKAGEMGKEFWTSIFQKKHRWQKKKKKITERCSIFLVIRKTKNNQNMSGETGDIWENLQFR